MPSRRSQDMLGLIRSHKQIASAVNHSWIMTLDPPLELVSKLRLGGTSAAPLNGLGLPGILVEPKLIQIQDAVILHLHGGAYVSGGILQCRALISPICTASGVRAATFSYRLAPKFPYPAQLEDALTVYHFLRGQGYPGKRMIFVGESAGGNLALELAMRLRDTGEEMPAALVLLSPWTDLAQRGESYQTLQTVDATLDAKELLENAVAYAGSRERLDDPDISPLYADLAGLPPVQIHCGTHEILLSDSEEMERRLQSAGVEAQLIRWAGMCHVFQAFGFDESRASIQQIGAFIRRQLEK